jgi:hypothetical protein
MDCLLRQEGEGLGYKNSNVWKVPVDGSAPACNLTGSYDLQAAGWTINDLGGPETVAPTWSTDGRPFTSRQITTAARCLNQFPPAATICAPSFRKVGW